MRKKLIAGNWKMHYSPAQAVEFVNSIKSRIDTDASDVVLCVPFTNLAPVMTALADTHIKVGAQNMHYKENGAYTGEISGEMLSAMEVPYVIIGHSERRAYYNETDDTVNWKVLKAISLGITPILCVGESLEQRQANITVDLICRQTLHALRTVPCEDAVKVVIAYEPIWAIGTGETATADQAEEACAAIRQALSELYDPDTAEAIRILYGGSVNAANAAELFGMPNIDGGLVGGASIKPEFERIVHFG